MGLCFNCRTYANYPRIIDPSTWWDGADPGRDVKVTLEFKAPTHRTDNEIMDEIFVPLMLEFNGGYGSTVLVQGVRNLEESV